MEYSIIELAREEINKQVNKRNWLLSKQELIKNNESKLSINHLNGLKETLSLPENIELLNDTPIKYKDLLIEVPQKRKEIVEKHCSRINDPINMYIYLFSVSIMQGKKEGMSKFFNPQIIKIEDYRSEAILGRLYSNIENPEDHSPFIRRTVCEKFEKEHTILLPKKGTLSNINDIRTMYLNILITYGYEYAINYLLDYFDIMPGEDDLGRSLKQKK